MEGLRPSAVGITADGYLDEAAGLLHQLPLLGPAGTDEEADEVVSRELLSGDGQLPRHLGGRRSSGGGASAGHGGQQSLLGQVGRPGHGGVDRREGRLLGGRVVISVVAPPLALGRCRRDGGSCGKSASSAAGRPERHGQRLLGRPGRGGVDLDHSPGGRSRSGSGGRVRAVGGRRRHGGVAGLGSGGGHGGGARKAGRDGPGAGDCFLGGGHMVGSVVERLIRDSCR